MHHKSIEDLAFQQVLSQIQAMSLSEEGRTELPKLPFLYDKESLGKRQTQLASLLRLRSFQPNSNLSSFPSVAEQVKHLSDPRFSLEGSELYDLGWYIRSSHQLHQFCHSALDDGTTFPVLHPLMGEIFSQELLTLVQAIEDTLDASGQVKESHPALRTLRKQVEAAKQERSRYCNQFIQRNKEAVQSDQEALRDGRLVIPVRSDRRAAVQGFITSTSSSGSTVFMEPYALVEMNNSVVMAQNQILIEIAKILAELNAKARECRHELFDLLGEVGRTDALLSIAGWTEKFDAHATDLSCDQVNLLEARHPLLGKKAVPISIRLDEVIKAVVISGPNAGGKTVTIKTVGLFALLNQFCGYLPAKEGSSLPLFDNVFTDIGDEQSIEAALSTFSGHMKQVGMILRSISSRSLVILDELGSGTDPVEGSAIARSTLEYCLQHAALTLVTSHHGVLKQFAYAKQEVINASMEFNEHSHLPTFRVIQGLPGESHALDTARLMLLPEEVLAKAEQYLGSEAVQVGSIIKDLEAKRRELEREEREMHQRFLSLQREVKELQLKELRVKQQETQLKQEQTTSLNRFLLEKRKELENLVSDLKQGELTKTKTKSVKTFVQTIEERVKLSEQELGEAEEALEEDIRGEDVVLSEGMDVLCGTAKREGKILKDLGKGRFLVALGSMRMTLKASQLSVPKRQETAVSVMFQSSAAEPKLTLDVRGMTLEQALAALDTQLESALVHGMTTFSIIHGYGDGILSKGIGEYLRSQRSVKDHRFALPEDGGMGKTYVML